MIRLVFGFACPLDAFERRSPCDPSPVVDIAIWRSDIRLSQLLHSVLVRWPPSRRAAFGIQSRFLHVRDWARGGSDMADFFIGITNPGPSARDSRSWFYKFKIFRNY
jgi:hypothetical protein